MKLRIHIESAGVDFVNRLIERRKERDENPAVQVTREPPANGNCADPSHQHGLFSAEDLAKITGGTWVTAPPDDWRSQNFGFCRSTARPASLLIPKSESFRYGVDLSKIGASKLQSCAILIDGSFDAPSPLPRLIVTSVSDAMAAIAVQARKGYRGTICAITGSVGKSSTCTLLHHALSRQHSCAARDFNRNVFDGICVQTGTLSDEQFAVLEIAVSALPRSSPIVRPHLAVLTAVAPAHLTYTGTLLEVAERKASLFTGLEPGGIAIINRQIPFFERVSEIARKHAQTLTTYGDHPEAEVKLLGYNLERQLVRASVHGGEIEYPLGMDGRHMALNSLAALAALHALGLDWRKLAFEFGYAQLPAGRGRHYQVRIGGRRIQLVDDSYNANPASMAAAIDLLAKLTPSPGGKRIAVLGEMLELGSAAPGLHAELAEPIVKAGVDKVYAAGELMTHLWDALPGCLRGQKVETAEELLPILQSEITDGDVILFKGSAANLSSITQALRDLNEFSVTSTGLSIASADAAAAAAGTETFVRGLLTRARKVSNLLRLFKRGIGASAKSGRSTRRRRRRSYTITLCGDTSLGDYYLSSLDDESGPHWRLRRAPLSFFDNVRPLIANSNRLIVNLETCLLTGRISPFEGQKKYLGWDDPERTLGVLKEIGVGAVSLANNHTMDFGGDGLLETIAKLEAAGISTFGAGENLKMASRPFTRHLKVAGREKALFVIGAFEFRRRYKERYDYYAAADSPGVNSLSRRRVTARIERLRRENPDALIIACPHWNRNYGWADKEIDLCSALIDAGADLVIGHGLHMLGQCHWSEAGTQVLSLGNFVFNSFGRYEQFLAPPFSLVARLDLKPEAEGWSSELKLYPIVTDSRRTDFQVQPVDRAMRASVYSLLAERAPDASAFHSHFEPGEDERGLHIRLTRPISPRFRCACSVEPVATSTA